MKSLILLLLSFLFCFGCSKPDSEGQKKIPIVLTSIPVYASFVERIAEDSVAVRTLVPPGADPHVYEPTPKQVQEAIASKVWFMIGEGFEKKIFTVMKEQNPELKTVEMWEGLPLLSAEECSHDDHEHCHHMGWDRHIWMSPRLVQTQVKKIASALILLFPEHRDMYQKNLNRLIVDLKKLESSIALQLAPFKGEAILVAHPSLTYFCHDYRLVQISVESEGKEPLPQATSKILELAKEHPIRCVIIQPQSSNKGASLIAQKLQLPLFVVDPYSSDYFKQLNYLAQVIAKP